MSTDSDFLEDCGIEIDTRWLVLNSLSEAPPEVINYAKSLLRIQGVLNGQPSHAD